MIQCTHISHRYIRIKFRRIRKPSSSSNFSIRAFRARTSRFELFELELLNSSFSSSNFSIRAVRACPLVETRQIVPRRAIRGSGISVNGTLPPSHIRVVLEGLQVISYQQLQCTIPCYVISCYMCTVYSYIYIYIHMYTYIHDMSLSLSLALSLSLYIYL